MNRLLEKIFLSDWRQIDEKISLPFFGRDIGSVQEYILEVLKTIIGFGGIVAVCFIVYAAYLFILASGDPDQIAKAQKMLVNSVIGLVLAAISFMVINFIIENVGDALATSTIFFFLA